MDDQGGAGGVPLHEGGDDAERRRPHASRRGELGERPVPGGTRAQDTDEASRLDRPQNPDEPRKNRQRWTGPAGD
ncbi:hypothetical protein DEJ50_02750 [Streptomyces venezuelae]|uniref:Uncharacterized protein n=1 Tax=Streptomyces venezuelae TaxID=54571 RepID=A0A5P2CY79_STRVZ|nr:hypothetical protein [Streptomyces venezuelae]QES46927.1 hypothetical protein DEJ50_02750 [Streptomyces venezuelae]